MPNAPAIRIGCDHSGYELKQHVHKFLASLRGEAPRVCTSTYMEKMTRAHNDSNVLCLGGKISGVFQALDIQDAWLATPDEGGTIFHWL